MKFNLTENIKCLAFGIHPKFSILFFLPLDFIISFNEIASVSSAQRDFSNSLEIKKDFCSIHPSEQYLSSHHRREMLTNLSDNISIISPARQKKSCLSVLKRKIIVMHLNFNGKIKIKKYYHHLFEYFKKSVYIIFSINVCCCCCC